MELSEKKLKKMYEKNLKILNELSKQKGNKTCADCCEKSPKWASSKLGVFLCIKCAGFHRKIASDISNVKSITLDNWTKEEIETMIDGGNDIVNYIYLNGSNKPLEADYEYIKNKYEKRLFSKDGSKQKKSDKDSLSILENMGFTVKSTNLKALELAEGDVQNAIELLLSGAVADTSSPPKPNKGKVEIEDEINLPKLPTRKISTHDSITGSAISLQSVDVKMPDVRKEKLNDSRDEISVEKKADASKTIQDERVRQALENAMEQLASFGFTDVSDTRTALRQARGDVEKALGILMKWKDDRIARENTKKEEELKKIQKPPMEKPNLLGSIDNISQSGNITHDVLHTQSTHLQPINSHNGSSLRYEVDGFTQSQSQPFNSLSDGKFQQIGLNSITYQPFQSTQMAQGTQIIQAIHHQTFSSQQPFQPVQTNQQLQPIHDVQKGQQNPIDAFSFDQLSSPTSFKTQPIQPSVKVFDLLGSSNINPFTTKTLLPIVSSQRNDNLASLRPKADNSKQTVALSNDLAGISFDIPTTSANTPKFFEDKSILQTSTSINQVIASPAKSSKDTIMSLYSAPSANQVPLQSNPFMFNQQSIPSRSQPRLSLVKTVNSNPFMSTIPNSGGTTYNPANIGNPSTLNYSANIGIPTIPNNFTNVGNASNAANVNQGDTNSFGRNYHLDNYSVSSLGVSEIFSAPTPAPSEKERIQASLFSDLTSFRR